MQWMTLAKKLLFPPTAVLLILTPISVVYLVYALAFTESASAVAVIAYVLSAYTLTIWCVRVPRLMAACRRFKEENRHAKRWFEDARFRVNVSLYTALIWNTAYAVIQLCLGLWHHTFWYYSLAVYYILLAVMRFFLVRHTGRYEAGERMIAEWKRYRACGIVFLGMNLVLSVVIFFMIYWNRTFHHHEITTITLAAYTFTSLTVAIVNCVRYRRFRSPAYSASKAISLTAACVSMITLESTMLTTFGEDTLDALTRKWLLGLTGGVIAAIVIIMAVGMIVRSTKEIHQLTTEET